MKGRVKLGIGIFGFAVAAVVVIFVLIPMLKKNKPGDGDSEPKPSGDTIIITNSGNRRETFVESPQKYCLESKAFPWCPTDSLTKPLEYWYDSENFDHKRSEALNVIVRATGECRNPSDCIKFKEVLDNDMNLIDIESGDGRSYVNTVIDDIYSGKLVVPDKMLKQIDINFETAEISPAPLPDGTFPKDKNGNEIDVLIPGVNTTLGIYIVMLVSKYKEAGKPKPTIKFEFKSGKAGDVLKKLRESV